MKDNEKIIRRVKRLLAMAEDASSPNEAMIAAKRARALMDKYQISKSDTELLDEQFLEAVADKRGSVRRQFLINLLIACANLNDCIAVIKSPPDVRYIFRGFKSDAIVAKLTFDYLVETCDRLCQKSDALGASEKNFFRLGFSEAIEARAYKIKMERSNLKTSSGKELTLCKQELVREHFGDLQKMRPRNTRPARREELSAYYDGVEKGSETSLDKQIKADRRDRLNNK